MRIYWLMYFTIIVYNVVDIYQTYHLIDKLGAEELNPYVNFCIQHFGIIKGLIISKIYFIIVLGVGLILYYFFIFRKRRSKIMFMTKWKYEDGYYESMISFREGLNPVLRARAVKQSNGTFTPVVRDHGNPGKMVASGLRTDLEMAKRLALTKAEAFIRGELNGYTTEGGDII
jgi:hypothetical protein